MLDRNFLRSKERNQYDLTSLLLRRVRQKSSKAPGRCSSRRFPRRSTTPVLVFGGMASDICSFLNRPVNEHNSSYLCAQHSQAISRHWWHYAIST
ncbi:hypothetical protein K474DRAFT_1083972 [Panus rudis PR-1116 ss-1]|nr:hypothetical protein K474DRAFT_1083972 [Panus rudis PR-1116 ss-1]